MLKVLKGARKWHYQFCSALLQRPVMKQKLRWQQDLQTSCLASLRKIKPLKMSMRERISQVQNHISKKQKDNEGCTQAYLYFWLFKNLSAFIRRTETSHKHIKHLKPQLAWMLSKGTCRLQPELWPRTHMQTWGGFPSVSKPFNSRAKLQILFSSASSHRIFKIVSDFLKAKSLTCLNMDI